MAGYNKALPGVGWVSLVPSGATPTPIHLALIENASYDIKQEQIELRDSDGYVVDSYPGKTDVTGKLSLKDASNSLIAAVTRGVTVTAGTKIGASHSATIPTTPFQITVTQGATFADDLGVMNLTNGKAMTAGATATGTGVYAVNSTTGVYTFHTDDAGDSVLIMYRYTSASADTTATVAKVTSSTAAPLVSIHLYRPNLASKNWGFYVPSARIPGLSAAFKTGAWSDVSLDWTATLSATNQLIYTYGPE